MRIESLALRVLMPSFHGRVLTPEWTALLREGLAGICLFGSNIGDGTGVRGLTDAIHAANPACVVALDEEGGDVTRLHALSGSPVLGAAALGAAHDLALTRVVGGMVGIDLVAAGVDLDLAPVADVNSNADNPVIGTRSFGPDPGAAASHVAAWVHGLQDAGVAACVKHFPGHGDTGEDSHLALPVLEVTLETLRQRELLPFAAAIAAGTRTVMTSHIVVPALDPDLPATLSGTVLGLLREELGFTGVIVSDALDMAGASASRGIPEAAVLSLVAGADFLCIGPDKPASLVREIAAAIAGAVADGRLPLVRLEEAAERVSSLRPAGGRRTSSPRGADFAAEAWDGASGEASGGASGGASGAASGADSGGVSGRPAAAALVEAASRSLTVDGDLPDLAGAGLVSVETRANIAVGDVPWGLVPDTTLVPGGSLASIGTGPVIVQVRDAHRRPEVAELLDRLAEAGAVPTVVEWGWPGPRHGTYPRICTRGYSRPGAEAVTALLRNAGWDR